MSEFNLIPEFTYEFCPVCSSKIVLRFCSKDSSHYSYNIDTQHGLGESMHHICYLDRMYYVYQKDGDEVVNREHINKTKSEMDFCYNGYIKIIKYCPRCNQALTREGCLNCEID